MAKGQQPGQLSRPCTSAALPNTEVWPIGVQCCALPQALGTFAGQLRLFYRGDN